MRGAHTSFALVMISAVLLVAGLVSVEAQSQPPSSGNFLGADPGYGMRSWEDLYPGLNLTPDQRRQLANIRVETLRQVCAARDDLSVGPQERMRRIGEARRVGRERELAILTPEQRDYLTQNPPCRSPLLDRQNQPRNTQGRLNRQQNPPRNSSGLVPGVNDLTDEQTNRIAAIRRETQRQVQEAQRDRTLTPEQRTARIETIRSEGHQRVMNELTPAQRQQFEQASRGQGRAQPGRERPSRGGADMRRGGPNYTGHPGYVPGVDDLTDQQMNRIAAIRQETRRQVQAVQRDRTLTPQQRSARIREIQQEGHDRVMAVLTERQRAAFEDRWRRSQGGRRQ